MASGRRTLRAIAGITIMFNPVIRQVIDPKSAINNLLPTMANLGDNESAMVNETKATVVIIESEDRQRWEQGQTLAGR